MVTVVYFRGRDCTVQLHGEYHFLLDEPDKCIDDEWFEEVDERGAHSSKVHSSKRSSKIRSKSTTSGSSRRTKCSSSKSSRERALEERRLSPR